MQAKPRLVAPDGGWGWAVLVAAVLVNLLIPGTIKSFGVLFVEFLRVFGASPTEASWMPSLCYFLYSSLGPFASILSSKFSYRCVAVLGGLLAASGLMLSYLANSVTYLYFSYGIMVGAGAGLSFPVTIFIVSEYFDRLRGLATGLCISGSAIGTIILPPLLQYILDHLGFRAAVLILGGILLNTLVCALFFHPVERHMKVLPEDPKRVDLPRTSPRGSLVPEQELHKATRALDLSILRDPLYLLILMSSCSSAIGVTNFIILLPVYASAEGYDPEASALLLSALSLLDLVGRVAGAALSDVDLVPKYYYFVGGLGVSGLALGLLPMSPGYGYLVGFCALFGLASGIYTGTTAVVLADMLGPERLASSYGISLFANGILQLVGPPLCNLAYERTGTFKPIFLALGMTLVCGTSIWAALPLIRRRKKTQIAPQISIA